MKLWSRTAPAAAAEPPGNGRAPGIPPELLQRVKLIELKARRLVDDLFLGEYPAIFRGSGIEFDELRPYVPGDDIRSIDWKALARTGEPFVRHYREDRDLTVIFAVDVSASQRAGALPSTKGDLAAEICAVLALAAIRNKDRVGLLLFAGQPELYIRPAGGVGNVFRVVREMLWSQPRTPGTDIAAALQYLADVQKRKATVFLVSDFLSTGYAAALRSAARRHDLIGIRVREPVDEALPDAGLILLSDSETGALTDVDSSSAAVREAYAAHVRRLDAERRLLFGQAGIDEIDVTVGADYVPALLRFFRKRAVAVAG